MFRFSRLIAIPAILVLLGCQALRSEVLAPPLEQAPQAGMGTLSLSVRWPKREVQLIPLSANALRLRVSKNGSLVVSDVILSRPSSSEGAAIAQGSVRLNADTGLTVTVEAFREDPIASSSVSVASASATAVTVIANQRTSILLSLSPSFVPTLTSFSPSNGGNGVPVTLTGTFGDSGYYGISVNGAVGGANSGSSTSITAVVPEGATTGPLSAWADGATSSAGATFKVLESLDPLPLTAAASVGGTVQFSVPTATDTLGTQVLNPTVTRWQVVNPLAVNPISGTVTSNGLFTATATGTAWVRAWSGSLLATMSVTID